MELLILLPASVFQILASKVCATITNSKMFVVLEEDQSSVPSTYVGWLTIAYQFQRI